ncbi:hypothetical protein SB719_20155, partial [Pantoea sp. SIMBA_079]
PDAAEKEVAWQLERLSVPGRDALGRLPRLGEDSAGPLGAGLLASGELGRIIREIQDRLAQRQA